MKINKFLFFCILTICGLKSFSQDPSFSQFFLNRIYFNPGYSGMNDGHNLSLTYRRQWVNIPGKFETMFFSYDTDISMKNGNGLGGIGITAYNDFQGEGFLQTSGINLMLSTRFPSNKKSSIIIQPAMSIALQNKRISWEKLTFGDQYSPVYGKITEISNFKKPDEQQNIFPDFATGFVFSYSNNRYSNKSVNPWNFRFGFAMHHLFEPYQNFLGADSKLPRKYVSHLNFNISIDEGSKYIFAPGIAWEHQSEMNTLYAGLNFTWKPIILGCWYRGFKYADSYILNIGFIGSNHQNSSKESKVFKFSYSYDITISKLGSKSTLGSHEFTLTYSFDKNKKSKWKRREYFECASY